MFGFLRSLQIFFQSDCTACIPTSSVRGFLFPPNPRQHLLLVVLLMMAILTVVRWNLSVVLICISFMAGEPLGLLMGARNTVLCKIFHCKDWRKFLLKVYAFRTCQNYYVESVEWSLCGPIWWLLATLDPRYFSLQRTGSAS
jgi:hypothetical protein